MHFASGSRALDSRPSRARTPLGALNGLNRGSRTVREGVSLASTPRAHRSCARRRRTSTSSVDARDLDSMACTPRRFLVVRCLGLARQAAKACVKLGVRAHRRGSIVTSARADARSTRAESFFVDGRKHVEKGNPRRDEEEENRGGLGI